MSSPRPGSPGGATLPSPPPPGGAVTLEDATAQQVSLFYESVGDEKKARKGAAYVAKFGVGPEGIWKVVAMKYPTTDVSVYHQRAAAAVAESARAAALIGEIPSIKTMSALKCVICNEVFAASDTKVDVEDGIAHSACVSERGSPSTDTTPAVGGRPEAASFAAEKKAPPPMSAGGGAEKKAPPPMGQHTRMLLEATSSTSLASSGSHRSAGGGTEHVPFDLFISYAWGPDVGGVHTLQEITLTRVVAPLKTAGYKCWVDVDQPVGGGDLADSTTTAIATSSAVIICLSPQYAASQNCKMEAMYAKSARRPIFFVNVGDPPNAEDRGGYTPSGYDVSSVEEINMHSWLDNLVGDELWADCRTDASASTVGIPFLLAALSRPVPPPTRSSVRCVICKKFFTAVVTKVDVANGRAHLICAKTVECLDLVREALKVGCIVGAVGALVLSSIDCKALDESIEGAKGPLVRIETTAGRNLVDSAHRVSQIRKAFQANIWEDMERAVAAASSLRATEALSPEAEAEVVLCEGELADRRNIRMISLALSQGAAKGKVGELQSSTADAVGLGAVLEDALKQEATVGSFSPAGKPILRGAQLIYRLRVALNASDWGAVRNAVIECNELQPPLPEASRAEVIGAKDEADKHLAINEKAIAVEKGEGGGTQDSFLSAGNETTDLRSATIQQVRVKAALLKGIGNRDRPLIESSLRTVAELAGKWGDIIAPEIIAEAQRILASTGGSSGIDSSALLDNLLSALGRGAISGPVGQVDYKRIDAGELDALLTRYSATSASGETASPQVESLLYTARMLQKLRSAFAKQEWGALESLLDEIHVNNAAIVRAAASRSGATTQLANFFAASSIPCSALSLLPPDGNFWLSSSTSSSSSRHLSSPPLSVLATTAAITLSEAGIAEISRIEMEVGYRKSVKEMVHELEMGAARRGAKEVDISHVSVDGLRRTLAAARAIDSSTAYFDFLKRLCSIIDSIRSAALKYDWASVESSLCTYRDLLTANPRVGKDFDVPSSVKVEIEVYREELRRLRATKQTLLPKLSPISLHTIGLEFAESGPPSHATEASSSLRRSTITEVHSFLVSLGEVGDSDDKTLAASMVNRYGVGQGGVWKAFQFRYPSQNFDDYRTRALLAAETAATSTASPSPEVEVEGSSLYAATLDEVGDALRALGVLEAFSLSPVLIKEYGLGNGGVWRALQTRYPTQNFDAYRERALVKAEATVSIATTSPPPAIMDVAYHRESIKQAMSYLASIGDTEGAAKAPRALSQLGLSGTGVWRVLQSKYPNQDFSSYKELARIAALATADASAAALPTLAQRNAALVDETIKQVQDFLKTSGVEDPANAPALVSKCGLGREGVWRFLQNKWPNQDFRSYREQALLGAEAARAAATAAAAAVSSSSAITDTSEASYRYLPPVAVDVALLRATVHEVQVFLESIGDKESQHAPALVKKFGVGSTGVWRVLHHKFPQQDFRQYRERALLAAEAATRAVSMIAAAARASATSLSAGASVSAASKAGASVLEHATIAQVGQFLASTGNQDCEGEAMALVSFCGIEASWAALERRFPHENLGDFQTKSIAEATTADASALQSSQDRLLQDATILEVCAFYRLVGQPGLAAKAAPVVALLGVDGIWDTLHRKFPDYDVEPFLSRAKAYHGTLVVSSSPRPHASPAHAYSYATLRATLPEEVAHSRATDRQQTEASNTEASLTPSRTKQLAMTDQSVLDIARLHLLTQGKSAQKHPAYRRVLSVEEQQIQVIISPSRK